MHAGTHHCVTDDLQWTKPWLVDVSMHLCIEVGGGIFEHLLWDVPDVDETGFCPLQIIGNTMVSTRMHVMLVVMLFIT